MLEDFLFGNGPIRDVQQFVGRGHADAFRWIGLLGDTWGIMLALGIGMWLYGRNTAYALLGSVALAALSKLVLNLIFDVPRPSGPEIVVYEEYEISSFPSGHVYQTLIPWGVLYVRERLPLIVPVLVISAVGLSRIYLGVHYLGDVLFGIVFGVAFVAAYHFAWKGAEPWLHRRSTTFYAGLTATGVLGVLFTIATRVNTGRRWEIVGLIAGAGFALIVEKKRLDDRTPRPGSPRALAIAVGLAGLIPLAFWMRYISGSEWYVHVAAGLALIVWTLLVAPYFIQRGVHQR